MAPRPTAWTVSPRFLWVVLPLGFVLGFVLSLWGYAAPAAWCAWALGGLVQLTDMQRRQAADRIREALRRADIGIRQAARIMEMDPTEFERALNGERKLDLWRLEMLPPVFHQEHWPLLARDKGAPDSFRTFLKVLPVIDVQKGGA